MMRRILALLLIVGLFPAVTQASSNTSAKIRQLQQEIEANRQRLQHEREINEQKLAQKRKQVEGAKVRLESAEDDLSRTRSQIAVINSTLDTLNASLQTTQHKLAWNTLQLQAARKTLKLHSDLLAHRLVDTYERGDLGYLSVLLKSKSFNDFVERWEDLRLLIAANERTVRERKTAASHVALAESELQSTQVALQDQEVQQQQEQTKKAALETEQQNDVAVADQQHRRVAGEYAQLEDLTQAEENQIEAIIAQAERQIEAARQAAGLPVLSAPGILGWPVTGPITSPFGWRTSPLGSGMEFHQGLDIAADSGTPIGAAAAGTVIQAGWYGGYGNYILIDHGGGMSTGYGHCSRIYVSAGQSVQKGQTIGAVGSTGMSTGPHLHFEVRMHGKAVNPTAYLH